MILSSYNRVTYILGLSLRDLHSSAIAFLIFSHFRSCFDNFIETRKKFFFIFFLLLLQFNLQDKTLSYRI